MRICVVCGRTEKEILEDLNSRYKFAEWPEATAVEWYAECGDDEEPYICQPCYDRLERVRKE